MVDIPIIEIRVCLACNEVGMFDSIVYDTNNIQSMQKFRDWLDSKNRDNCTWFLKYIKTNIQCGYEYEELP